MLFGVEVENYKYLYTQRDGEHKYNMFDGRNYHADNDDCYECKTEAHSSVRNLMRNLRNIYMEDEYFWFHSYPNFVYGSASSHMHYSLNNGDGSGHFPDFLEKQQIEHMINGFYPLFLNSPIQYSIRQYILSNRMKQTTWSSRGCQNKRSYNNGHREYTFMTAGLGGHTIEFRGQEIAKHANQYLMFTHLCIIMQFLKQYNTYIQLEQFGDFETYVKPAQLFNKNNNENFEFASYTEPERHARENDSEDSELIQRNRDIILRNAEHITRVLGQTLPYPLRFYCGLDNKYKTFYKFVKTTVETDIAMFCEDAINRSMHSNNIADEKWNEICECAWGKFSLNRTSDSLVINTAGDDYNDLLRKGHINELQDNFDENKVYAPLY